MSGARDNDEWSNEEFDSALAAFFPEPPTVIPQHSESNAHSQDSDSETEVVILYPDPVNTDINVQDVTTDFVENILSNEESNHVEDAGACSVNYDDNQDPETQIIADKF